MSVGNDGMVKMVSLYHKILYNIFLCFVSLEDGERTKFLILPTLLVWPLV